MGILRLLITAIFMIGAVNAHAEIGSIAGYRWQYYLSTTGPYYPSAEVACRTIAGSVPIKYITPTVPGEYACWFDIGGYDSNFFVDLDSSGCADGYTRQADKSCAPSTPEVKACPVSHPVYPGTGAKTLTERDDAGSEELPISRTYRSDLRFRTNGAAGGWMFNWQRALDVAVVNSYSSSPITTLRDGGTVRVFSKSGTVWTTSGIRDTIEHVGSNWVYKAPTEGIEETYDAQGNLLSVRERNGHTTALQYTTTGQLTKVTAPSGRSLTFTYNAQGRVSSITAPDGAITQYDYNASGMLTTVTWPDNTTRQYVYEDTRFPTALTGVIDEAGVRYATYAYDDQGRAITSELTAGADRYQFQYQANGQTTVLTPDGGSSVYSFLKQNGVLLPTGVSAPCPTCGNTALSTSYDSNNNATSKTGYDGSTTSYTYDTLGRETQRIEGAGTANAKTTTTEWDPQQWLVTRVAAPNKIETFSYDANGNLLSHTVTPTGDANGSQGFGAAASGDANRIDWTYDSNGNVLTTIERNGTATIGTWTFTYDAQGNLLTLTNPEGKTGRVTQYDAAGRVVAATNVDGQSIQYGYNARGWLVDHYIGDMHIHYDYDAIGHRTAIYRQGSVAMNYVYDAAHRLIDIIDRVTAPRTTVQAQAASATLKSVTLDGSEEPRASVFDVAKDWAVRVRDTVLGWIRSMLFTIVKSANAQVAPVSGGTTGYGPPGPIPQGSQPMHTLPRADQTLDGNYDPVRLRPELGAIALMAKVQQACSAAVQTVVQVFSKSTPPGDCDQNGYEKLKKNVDSTCKPEPSRCSPGDAQADILRKLDIRSRCADARRKIMDTCFRGGDLAHISKWLFETAEANICKGFVQ
ncbi:RHS repeat protein [Ralstonia pickettii]|uniref:RHS repeat protein n=1 Tax=Ralstonia pickettii TaxID=329 RepID=A0A2N4TJF4_RALPI|nr:RHS repeat protein [Ralstonia pickettii]PLC39842.1 RHS repeat protein [Ralstonia pickettii]